jgi:A/G-specific adenine glycosylase
MEFGALQCIPASPDCCKCLFNTQCLACAQNKVSAYPIKQNKTRIKELYLYYFHIRSGDFIYLKKREEKGIWQNLYEFPLIESELPLAFEDLIQNKYFRKLFPSDDFSKFKLNIKDKKHVLTHRILYASFFEINLENESDLLLKYSKIKQNEIDKYPIHRLMQIYLETKF